MGSMTNSEGGEQNKQGTRKERERERYNYRESRNYIPCSLIVGLRTRRVVEGFLEELAEVQYRTQIDSDITTHSPWLRDDHDDAP